MATNPSDPAVEPQVALHWIGGGVAAFLLFVVIVRLIETFQTDNQQRTVTGIAIISGVMISVGVSPLGTFAEELAHLFEVVPTQYPEWITALLALETVFGLLYGFAIMGESGGLPAFASFGLALLGGLILLYSPLGGVFLILFAWILMEVSPANRW
jgi:hypothetical protein